MTKVYRKIAFLSLITIFILSVVSAFPVSADAHTKSLTLKLTKTYKECEVSLTFQAGGEYEAKITDPNTNKEYDFNKVSDTVLTCNLANAKEGEWVITITSENAIPKVTAKLDGNSNNTTDVVSGNIAVGKDIVGLKVYFKNDILVAEWTDDSVGNVNVRVTNLDNSEVIAKESVKEKSFEVQVPTTVKNISVGIVPSSSASVTGAEQLFTFEVPTYPSDVEVKVNPAEYVNTTDLTASVTTGSSYAFLVEINGIATYSTEYKEAGEYELPISLSQSNENNVLVYVIDENGNMFSIAKSYMLDVEAPTVALSSDYDNLEVYVDTVEITGTIKDFETFTINDDNVDVTTDGTFSYDVSLHLGENVVVVKATDLAGNVTEYDLTITQLEKKANFLPFYIGITVFILIIVAGVVYKMRKRIPNEMIESPKGKKNVREEMPKARKNTMNYSKHQAMSKAKKTKIIINILLPIFAAIYVFTVLLSVSRTASVSMESTIKAGDVIVGNRLAYVKKSPVRGDIVTLVKDNELYCKRVIGVAGDKIEFHDGLVYINDVAIEEDYLAFDTDTNCTKTFEVPEGCVFVMGDNRENSTDSRAWADPYVEINDIKAKIFFIWNI